MTIKEELALVRRAKDGDKDSLSTLWEGINPKLYGYLVNVLKDKSQADDILQETWLKAIAKIDKFTDRGVRFSAWLFAIARNECRQFWRQNAKFNSLSLEANGLDRPVQMAPSLEAGLLVDSILAKLTTEEQEILRLRFIGQLDFKAIAKIMAISVISARVRLHRILKKARSLT